VHPPSARRSGQASPPGSRRVTDLAVVAVVFSIIYASLSRPGRIDCSQALATVLRESMAVSGSDLIGNVFAYLLLGAAAARAWQQRRHPQHGGLKNHAIAAALAIGLSALLSFSMEAAQSCLGGRTSSAVDLFNNTLGASLGWFMVVLGRPLWRKLVGRSPGQTIDRRLLVVIALASLAWLIAQSAPWVPSIALDAIRLKVLGLMLQAQHIVRTGQLDWPRVLGYVGQWLVLALGLSLPLARPLAPIISFGAVLGLVWLAHLLVPRASLPIEALIALPVAAALALALLATGKQVRAAVMLIALLGVITLQELRPGDGPAHEFTWRLLVLHGDAIHGIRVGCQIAWFAMSLVAAGHVLTGRSGVWVAVAVIGLALLEWAQTAVPGRTPDLSPPMLALATAGLAAGLLGRVQHPSRRESLNTAALPPASGASNR
jgi:VanZ family protein